MNIIQIRYYNNIYSICVNKVIVFENRIRANILNTFTTIIGRLKTTYPDCTLELAFDDIDDMDFEKNIRRV